MAEGMSVMMNVMLFVMSVLILIFMWSVCSEHRVL